jgi:uncharacterized protein (DUF2267 family)
MNYDSFVAIVTQRAGIDHEQAGSISCFALGLLAQRISEGQAEDMARRLPEQLQPCMQHEGPRETYHADEFLRRIREQLGADDAVAQKVARAVMAALWTAAGPKEFNDMQSELPGDFLPLLETAQAQAPPPTSEPPQPFRGSLTADEFVRRVAQRAGLEPDRARKATEAVLETLALRVTEGQIQDLRPFIPPELHDPLTFGVLRSHGRALRMSVEEFLDEIAQREGEGLTREQAAAHARAVFSVLREAVGDKEFRDTVAQLSRDYKPLIDAAWTGTGPPAAGTSPGGTVPATETQPRPPTPEPPDFIGVLSAAEFIGRVGEQTGLDHNSAVRATDAVLEALALRITAGQIEDLKPFVPPELHAPLDRGVERSRGRARRMSLEHFLDEIAVQEGEGVTREQAAAHARAVFSVLQDAVPDREFRDTVAQLPAEYERLLPHVTRPQR